MSGLKKHWWVVAAVLAGIGFSALGFWWQWHKAVAPTLSGAAAVAIGLAAARRQKQADAQTVIEKTETDNLAGRMFAEQERRRAADAKLTPLVEPVDAGIWDNKEKLPPP